MRNRLVLIAASVIIAGFSGCAIHTPYKVIRFQADYNTERACNCQVEIFDHLPLKTARVKVARWGYNVGEGTPSGTGTFGIGTGVWEDRLFFWRWFGKKKVEEEVYMAPPTPPGEPLPEALLPLNPESMPQLPPPAPPMDSTRRSSVESAISNKFAAMPRTPQGVSQIGYQSGKTPPKADATKASWVFLPSSAPRLK